MRRAPAGTTAALPRTPVVARPAVEGIGGRVDASAVGALGERAEAALLHRAAGVAGATCLAALPITINVA